MDRKAFDEWLLEGFAEKESNNIIDVTKRSGFIVSGAVSGARNSYGEAANQHAKRYYGLVRSMTTDVKRVAKTSGFSEAEIAEIKQYIFYDEHDLGDGVKARFTPDYMMAESWRRLIDGRPEPHDITMLKHEEMEKTLIKQGLSQDEAHIKTSKVYNYGKEAEEFYAKIKKYRKE